MIHMAFDERKGNSAWTASHAVKKLDRTSIVNADSTNLHTEKEVTVWRTQPLVPVVCHTCIKTSVDGTYISHTRLIAGPMKIVLDEKARLCPAAHSAFLGCINVTTTGLGHIYTRRAVTKDCIKGQEPARIILGCTNAMATQLDLASMMPIETTAGRPKVTPLECIVATRLLQELICMHIRKEIFQGLVRLAPNRITLECITQMRNTPGPDCIKATSRKQVCTLVGPPNMAARCPISNTHLASTKVRCNLQRPEKVYTMLTELLRRVYSTTVGLNTIDPCARPSTP